MNTGSLGLNLVGAILSGCPPLFRKIVSSIKDIQ